tara:strand:- start:5080 stop:6960 length:1881 start_codon:yes stop_codon:yes gene_type:complete
MLPLKSYSLPNKQEYKEINELITKLSNININNFSDLKQEQDIPTKGHHFKNLNTEIKMQIKNTIKTYLSNNCILAYYNFFKNYVASEFNDLSNKIGLDYGCWFSISSSIYSLLNKNKIYAIDYYNKETIDTFNKSLKNNNIEYYHSNNIDNISTQVDWIVIYDVIDCWISDIPVEIDFSNKLEYLRNLLNDDGILVITDNEKSCKIKLVNLEKIISKFFMNYKIHSSNNGRFIITCYRNISIPTLINFRSFSYTGTSFTCRKFSNIIDACNGGTYFNNKLKTSECSNCGNTCKLTTTNSLGKVNLMHNNLRDETSVINKIYNKKITIYYSRHIYAMLYSYINKGHSLEEAFDFWGRALTNNLPSYDYHMTYENFCEDYIKEINKFCEKYKIKYNNDFISKRCNIYNGVNDSEIHYEEYKKNNGICENKIYQKLFNEENIFGSTISDNWKNFFSKQDLQVIYDEFKNNKLIKKHFYDLNIIVTPEKCFETYFLFKPIGTSFEKSDIFNKEMNNYSIILKEKKQLQNHYIERAFNNIKNNSEFNFEILIKTDYNKYNLEFQFTDKSGKINSKLINLSECMLVEDNFKKVNFLLNSSYGNNICILKIILMYDNKIRYIGDSNRLIELIM